MQLLQIKNSDTRNIQKKSESVVLEGGGVWLKLLPLVLIPALFVASFSAARTDQGTPIEVNHAHGGGQESLAHAPGQCLSQHLAEAMAINQARQPLYGRLSLGASVGVSDLLILSESLALPAARVMERWARPLVRAGVDIFCDVVVSMDGTPSFPQSIDKPSEKEIRAFNSWSGAGTWWILMAHALLGNDSSLLETLEMQMKRLESSNRFYCMQRHLLESVARAVTLAPEHRRESKRQGHSLLGHFLVRFNLVNQVMLIPFGLWLDHKAFEVQKEGIPIICADVPAIPRR